VNIERVKCWFRRKHESPGISHPDFKTHQGLYETVYPCARCGFVVKVRFDKIYYSHWYQKYFPWRWIRHKPGVQTPLPRFWGIARQRIEVDEYLVMPIPLNVTVALSRRFWLWVKFGAGRKAK